MDVSVHERVGRFMATADLPLIVAMAEAGWDGWYSDWWNGGEGGPPMWETFHLSEVRELLERNWQAGDDRAVAGVSMGGFGAMSDAARHPELFQGADSFSGALPPVDRGLHGALPMPLEAFDGWSRTTQGNAATAPEVANQTRTRPPARLSAASRVPIGMDTDTPSICRCLTSAIPTSTPRLRTENSAAPARASDHT